MREIILDPHGDLFPGQVRDINEATLSESYRRLHLIYALGRSICSTTDIERLLDAIIDAIEKSIALERCFVAVVNEQGKLQFVAGHNIELPEEPADWPVSKTLVTRALRDGLSILCFDALLDERFSKIQSISVHNTRSVLCVPLGPKGSRTGVIYADNRIESGSFSELDLQFLTALSHYIYLAISNARELLKAKSQRQLSEERCAALQGELLREHHIVGKSQGLLKAYGDLRRTAAKEVPILLLGETGTGKELFAKATHKLSRRSEKVFMPLNIAELAETIVESELFGHDKGAFSGATARKIGRLEMTDEGTLFLDEVGEIPLHIQAKLLRVLETGEFMRVGGSRWIHTNVRLVCATNKALEDLVRQGRFREDLYYRLKGATIHIPPLRERAEDIPELTGEALKKIGSNKSFSEDALKCMRAYSWPGNVRQLVHLVQELDAVSEARVIEAEELPPYMKASAQEEESEFKPLQYVLALAEEKHIRRAMEICKGDNESAIKLLGISRGTFFERKKRYHL